MHPNSNTHPEGASEQPADPRPRYEPPRITKRRSVRRVTGEFSGANAQGGASAEGIATIPPHP